MIPYAGDMRNFQENIHWYLWSWVLEVGGGVDVKFWMFSGRERATKIEQVQTKEEFGSFGDNVYHKENQNIY